MTKVINFFMMLALLLSSSIASSMDCKTHTIYCRIIELNPSMDKSRAFWISNLIYKESKIHKIDPMISVAILTQENRFRSLNTFKVEEKDERFCDEKGCYHKIVIQKTVVDMGISQINIHTARHYDLDYERLFNFDTEYAIKCHFEILKDKMKLCASLGEDSWTCYHSKTEDKRLIYKEMVSKYLK